MTLFASAPAASQPRSSAGERPPEAAPAAPSRQTPTQDASRRTEIRAVRLTEPLTLDGRLDEEAYARVAPLSHFVQQEPNEGQPATEDTDVWIFFDASRVYVSARLHVTRPERITANELRRDNVNIFRNDYFGITLDTMFDHRSALYVMTNALGAQRDALVTDETRSVNFDYNAIWDVKSQRFEGGWTTEFAIPFKSLRYPQRREQVWSVLIARADWWKNEFSFSTPVPRSDGLQGAFRVSAGATLVGVEAPPPALNLEMKPYAAAGTTTTPAPPGSTTTGSRNLGVDVKYGLTKSLAADFTYNTDFAQAEVDEQQINLTRFSLFYPEKRDFFLEGQGLFTFGGASANGTGETPLMFFSRRIGLHNGQTVPVQAGGRLIGSLGAFNIGVLSIQTDALSSAGLPSLRSSVVRVKRNILRRSSVGVLATERTPSAVGHASNYVVGADLSLALFKNVEAVSYWAESRTAGREGDQTSYRARLFFNGDKYGLDIDQLKVGREFNPEVGFMARTDFERTYLLGRFSPRPRWRGVRRVAVDGRFDHIEGASDARLQTRTATAGVRSEFRSGEIVSVSLEDKDDRPQRAFALPGGLMVAPGIYTQRLGSVALQLGSQRQITGTLSGSMGGFYGGDQVTVGYNGRAEISTKLAVEPRVSLTRIEMGGRRVLTTLVSARTTYGLSPRTFISALVQYNSAAGIVGVNARFRWEYLPGSDLFLVYSEGHDTTVDGFRGQSNRQFVAKLTRLFRF